MVYGSRTLNNNGMLLGLNVYDLIGAVAVMIVCSVVLQPLKVEFLSVPAGILALTSLIPIRLKYRRRIIRDSVGFWIGARLIHEVKHAKSR
jgi:hypothetical protein